MGTLLGDIRAEQQLRERTEMKAKAEAREAAGERHRRYVSIVTNYVKDQSLTYEEAAAQLKEAQGTETDPELKALLTDFVKDLSLTRQGREVANLAEDYQYGRKSYDAFKTAMGGITATNDLIRGAVSKYLADARKTENNRLLTRWTADYKAGNLPYERFVSQLDTLRSAPDQTDPSDVAAISAHIEAVRDNEQGLQDNRVASRWQQTGDASAALQYFNQRLAGARNVKDASNVQQYIQTIMAADQKRGNATTTATSKYLTASAKDLYDEYYKTDLATALAAAKNDPAATKAAYGAFQTFITGVVLKIGSPDGWRYEIKRQGLDSEGDAAAALAERGRLNTEIARLRKTAEDKDLDPVSRATAWSKLAGLAFKAQTNTWLSYTDIDGNPQQSGFEEFQGLQDEAATQVEDIRRDLVKTATGATAEYEKSADAMYRGAHDQLVYDDKGKLQDARAQKKPGAKYLTAALGANVTFDGSMEDKKRFVDWLAENPGEEGNLRRAAGIEQKTEPVTIGGVTYTDKYAVLAAGKDVPTVATRVQTVVDLAAQIKKLTILVEDARDPLVGPIKRAVRENSLSIDVPEDVSRLGDARRFAAEESRRAVAKSRGEEVDTRPLAGERGAAGAEAALARFGEDRWTPSAGLTRGRAQRILYGTEPEAPGTMDLRAPMQGERGQRGASAPPAAAAPGPGGYGLAPGGGLSTVSQWLLSQDQAFSFEPPVPQPSLGGGGTMLPIPVFDQFEFSSLMAPTGETIDQGTIAPPEPESLLPERAPGQTTGPF